LSAIEIRDNVINFTASNAGFNSNRDAATRAKGELESKYKVKVVTVEGDISQSQSVDLLFQAVKVVSQPSR
jgi:hypothetical protein